MHIMAPFMYYRPIRDINGSKYETAIDYISKIDDNNNLACEWVK